MEPDFHAYGTEGKSRRLRISLPKVAFVVHRGDAGMLLEIPAEERLVRKLKLVGDLLYAEMGRLQQGLDFENHVAVYDAFGCCAGHVLYHG